jgi:hypothetical protein
MRKRTIVAGFAAILGGATVAASLAASGAVAGHAARTPAPKLRPIHAVFKPAPQGQACAAPYCTTTYTERAKGKGLKYTWSVSIPTDPGCADGFHGGKPTAAKATWYHADVAEGGPCDHSVYEASGIGHPGWVTVVVSTAKWRCTAKFHGTQGPQGQKSANGPKPAKCKRTTKAGGGNKTPKWSCNYGTHSGSDRTVLFDSGNPQAVQNGGKPVSFSTHNTVYCLGFVQTYHWNYGAGAAPGKKAKIVIKRAKGPTVAGIKTFRKAVALHAKGSPGSNNVLNANWYAYTTTNVFIDGTYTCQDTGRKTWAQNQQSHGFGFCHVEVYPAVKK